MCDLVFKDPKVWPSYDEEKQRYLKHNNSLDDKGYRDFLLVLVEPLTKELKSGMKGLDYGCGPAPLLSTLIKEKGFECESYDPYFFNDKILLTKKYDFITCNEVVEHFHYPDEEFKKLFELLDKDGVLVIRTQLTPNDFNNWWYHSDVTHVVFYSLKTFDWITKRYGAYSVSAKESDFIFLRKVFLAS